MAIVWLDKGVVSVATKSLLSPNGGMGHRELSREIGWVLP